MSSPSAKTLESSPAEPSSAPPLEYKRLLPRSIWGIMLLTLFAGGIFAVHSYVWDGSLEVDDLAETALFALALVVCGGLLQQCAHLLRVIRSQARSSVSLEEGSPEANTPHDRFSTWVAVLARLGAVVMIFASSILRLFGQSFGVPVSEWFPFYFLPTLYWETPVDLIWQPMAALWLIVGLGFGRQSSRTPTKSSHFRKLLRVLGLLCAGFLVLAAIFDSVLPPFLNLISLRFRELMHSTADRPLHPQLAPDVLGRFRPAAIATLISLSLLFICVILLWYTVRLARRTPRAQRRTTLLFTITAITTLIYLAMISWIVAVLLPTAAPDMASASSSYSKIEILINGLPLVILVVGILSIRLTRKPPQGSESESQTRMRMPVCWHERSGVLLILGAAMMLANGLSQRVMTISTWLQQNARADIYQYWQAIYGYFYWEMLIHLEAFPYDNRLVDFALILLCLTLAWRGRRKRLAMFSTPAPNYGSPGRFAVIAILVALLVVFSVPQICLTGFMIHAVPWYL